MDRDIKRVLEAVARKNGMTVEEVYEEIRLAIQESFKTEDPEARRQWDAIPHKGLQPTPEEVIRALAASCGGYDASGDGMPC